MIESYSYYIGLALEQAKLTESDVPIAALIVRNGEIIASAVNSKELLNDPTSHAEMIVIREAAQKLGSWRLEDVTLYVTLEPCPMCAAAIMYSRIPKVVFGAYDALYGAMGSAIDMSEYIRHRPQVIGGIEEEACKSVLQSFFQKCRGEQEKTDARV